METRDYKSTQIQSFSFEVEKDESSKTCTLSIKSGAAEKVLGFRSRAESILQSARVWYSIFRPNNYGASIVLASVFGVVIFGCILGLLWLWRILPTENLGPVIVLSVSNIFIFIFLLIFLARKAFPPVTFYLGLSRQRAEAAKGIRNLLFVVIGLGLVASVAANYLFEFVKAR